jgi:predicted dehydrogenase
VSTQLKSIKLGIIGLGNIAQQHIDNIQSGQVERCIITALCSRQPSELSERLGIAHFADYKALIDSGSVDAVLIASPTFAHKEMAQYALNRNIHVMLEKPIALSSSDGEALVKAAGDQTKFGLMLNQRADPTYQKMKEIVDSGVLGKVQRTHWTMTNWFRPEIYFQVSDWRATFKGEGGGLLVNQCIHNLDVFQWICGMPSSLRAFCEFGKYHDIEVEDEVTAYLRYPNKATGVFVASTGEAPGINRFDIIGDKGSLQFDKGRLTHTSNEQSTSVFSRDTNDMFGMPSSETKDITADTQCNQHAVIMNNFVQAILDDVPLLVSAEMGLASLDLANAMLMSTWQQQTIEFPLDRAQYQSLLDKKVASSSLRDKSDRSANIDMQQSYR